MIRLALRARPLMRLSLRGFIPERLAGLTASAIARQPLRQGNRPGVLGDLFAVDVSASAEDRLVIDGSDERLDDVGAGMSNGELVVEGNVGARVGLEMSGGRILVRGSASAGAGTAMSGGKLRIIGDAGDHIGTALPGERQGMRDGTVIVEGAAGASVGDRMRRGLIVIVGICVPVALIGAARRATGPPGAGTRRAPG